MRWGWLCLVTINLLSGIPAVATPASDSVSALDRPSARAPCAELLRRPVTVSQRTLDIRDFLEELSRHHGISIMASSRVRGIFRATRDEHGSIKRPAIEGETMAEALNYATRTLGFGWRLIDGSLYVAEESHISDLVDRMNSPRPTIIRAAFGKRLNAKFGSVDMHQLARILGQHANIDIRVATSVQDRLLLQAIDVPWERVLLAMVYLNGLRMIESEFSITIIDRDHSGF